LGSLKELSDVLGRFNTGPDGAAASPGRLTCFFHGPGMIVEVPTGQPAIQQAIVTVTDAEFAWPVLTKLCRALAAKMVDIETGQTFGAGDGEA
jgi:hypothetical protein